MVIYLSVSTSGWLGSKYQLTAYLSTLSVCTCSRFQSPFSCPFHFHPKTCHSIDFFFIFMYTALFMLYNFIEITLQRCCYPSVKLPVTGDKLVTSFVFSAVCIHCHLPSDTRAVFTGKLLGLLITLSGLWVNAVLTVFWLPVCSGECAFNRLPVLLSILHVKLWTCVCVC